MFPLPSPKSQNHCVFFFTYSPKCPGILHTTSELFTFLLKRITCFQLAVQRISYCRIHEYQKFSRYLNIRFVYLLTTSRFNLRISVIRRVHFSFFAMNACRWHTTSANNWKTPGNRELFPVTRCPRRSGGRDKKAALFRDRFPSCFRVPDELGSAVRSSKHA